MAGAVPSAGLVTSAKGLNPEVNQIYPIVNSLFQQMTGRTDIQAVDTASLISLGQEVDNLGKNDLWLNSLAKRIGYTIDGYRVYRNKFADLYRTQMEWGAFVQKITVEMPEAKEDKMYDVGYMDGQSIDQYIINNPKVHQRIFDKETPYSFYITMATKLLREAFLSSYAMQGFINQVFGKVQNKIEFVLEELARIAVANFIINLKTSQEFHLVTAYNNMKGTTLTPVTAKFDADFLRFAIGWINTISNNMETMSVIYNSDRFDRFTPKSEQRLYMLGAFMTAAQTVVSYEAFNPQYVTANPDIILPYWQASGTKIDMSAWNTISSIQGTVGNEKSKTQRNVSNLIGVLFDRDAIGTFRQEEDVLTTPVNARGAYYNTFWHEKQLWFNDMSENGVAFYLD